MVTEVRMPQLGESITEGTLVRWLKRPGERVARDELLFEITTDKVDTEIPSPAAGILKEVYVQEGETVPVDTPVCLVCEDGSPSAAASAGALASEPAEPSPSTSVPAPSSEPAAGPAGGTGLATGSPPARLSPAVRRLVREHGVDPAAIRGSGEAGRITRDDVLAHLERREVEAAAAATGGAYPAGSERTGALSPEPNDRVEPLSVLRRQIASHMVESKRVAPHASTLHEIDMTEVERQRTLLAERWKPHDLRPTYLPFVVQAVARALRTEQTLNASIRGEEVVYHADVNVGVAVAVEGGLVVPVIRQADRRDLLDITRSIRDLARRARVNALKPEEVQVGTFTITNPGGFGSLLGLPIIHQPQVAILCLGAVQKRVVVLEGTDSIAVRPMAYFTITFDHRLVDGVVADRFVASVKGHLEAGGVERGEGEGR